MNNAALEFLRDMQADTAAIMRDEAFVSYPTHLRAGAFADDDPVTHRRFLPQDEGAHVEIR